MTQPGPGFGFGKPPSHFSSSAISKRPGLVGPCLKPHGLAARDHWERVFLGSITKGKKKLQKKHSLHLTPGKTVPFIKMLMERS